MGMIDLENFDKLPPEMQKQFAELLKQHPQLESKLKGASHELNTPTKLGDDEGEGGGDPNVMDYRSVDDIPQESSSKTKPPTLRVSVQPTAEEMEREERKVRQKEKKARQAEVASELKQPDEVANFSPKGKQHPVLKKLRASLGMSVFQKPLTIQLGGITYEMMPLVRDSMTKAITLAALNSLNDAEFRANQDLAIIAHSVQTMDNVPLVEIFSIPTEEMDGEVKRPIGDIQRRERAVLALFYELKDSPPELADSLITFYQQEFPPRDLIGPGKTTAHCPTPDCTYTRIVGEGEESYCPYHGTKMAAEGQLPNPF